MHILTADGKVVEGQPLSDEEISIVQQIKTEEAFGNYPIRHYLTQSERTALTQFLFENFYLTRRKPWPEPEPDVIAAPEPETFIIIGRDEPAPTPEAANV